MNKIGTFFREENSKVRVDNSGNVILVGEFQNTIDINLGSGIENITSNGNSDFFIAKYTDSLDFIWGFNIGGISTDHVESIAIDTNNNIYVTGNFNGFVDFDPSTGVTGFTAIGGQPDIFLAKYSPDGNLIWAFPLGTASTEYGIDVEVDHENNPLILGHFQGTIDFDPSVNTFNLTSFGNFDVCIGKYSEDGNLLMAFNVGGNSTDRAEAMDIYPNGDFVITGRYANDADFDPSPSGTVIIQDYGIYVAKYTSSGDYIWAFGIQCTGNSHDIAVDNTSEIVLTGEFNLSADFQSGPETFNLTSNGNQDIFLVKYDNSRDVIWGHNIGALGEDEGNALRIDQHNNIFLTGFFSQVVDFDPSASATVLMSNGDNDLFLSKFNPNGNLKWAFGLGGNNDEIGLDIHPVNDLFYVTGTFMSSTDFNIYQPESLVLNTAGFEDIYIGYYPDFDCYVDTVPPQISEIDSFEYTILDSTILINIPSVTAIENVSGIKYAKVRIDSVATIILDNQSGTTYSTDTVLEVPISMSNFTYIYELCDSCFNISQDTFYFSIEDNQLPNLLDLIIFPLAMDLSAGSIDFHINLEVKDSISGLDSINSVCIDITLPPNNHKTLFAHRISGDSAQGIYTVELNIPDTIPEGLGTIDTIKIIDKLFNKSVLTASELIILGYTTEFEISNFNDTNSIVRTAIDFYVNGLDNGIIEKLNTGDCYKTTLNNLGDLQTFNVSCTEGQRDLIMESGNIIFDSFLMMKSPNGSCWLLEVDTLGTIFTAPISCPGSTVFEIENGNIYIGGSGNGIIIKSSDDACWVLKICSDQVMKAFKIQCP